MSQIARTPDSPFLKSGAPGAASRNPLYLPLDLTRYVLRKLILAVVTVLSQAWRHPVITLLAVTALFAGYQQLDRESGTADTTEAASADSRVGYIEPAPSVLAFLEAQRVGDAEATWATFSESWKSELLNGGETPEVTRQSYADLETAGMSFEASDYIGGRRQSNGETVYTFSTPQTEPGHDTRDFVQVFVVDADGLISQRNVLLTPDVRRSLQ
jgi:hypothetical protein